MHLQLQSQKTQIPDTHKHVKTTIHIQKTIVAKTNKTGMKNQMCYYYIIHYLFSGHQMYTDLLTYWNMKSQHQQENQGTVHLPLQSSPSTPGTASGTNASKPTRN